MSDIVDYGDVVRRKDGSYVIRKNGGPYHVPDEGIYADLYKDVHAYAEAHPDKVKSEEYEDLLCYSSVKEAFLSHIDCVLRDFADKKGYGSILSARMASGPFAQDKIFADKAYNDVWSIAISLMPGLEDGSISLEKAKAMLPKPKWSM